MFFKRLKQELAALRESLSVVQQVKESLDTSMIGFTLDPRGVIQQVNEQFMLEMLYKAMTSLAVILMSWSQAPSSKPIFTVA
ncbi:hypothetical protein ACFQDN_24400 [Pseudomonas asuensis]